MNGINERDWAARTAMRLHIWQESFANDEAEARGAAVWEYIAGAFAELGETDERFRANSFRALDAEFPFYQERKVLNRPEEAGPQPPSLKQALTAKETLANLLTLAPTLKEEEREDFARQLAEVGFVVQPQSMIIDNSPSLKSVMESELPVAVPVTPDELSRLTKTLEKIQSVLGADHFDSDSTLYLTRSMQMLGLMSEQFLVLHPQIWSMWEKIATNNQYTSSFSKPSLSPDEALAKFLQGASTTKRNDVAQLVTKTYGLATALVSAVEIAGLEFAAWFFEKFGPQNIEAVVQYDADGGDSDAAQYWQRYRQMTEAQSAEELSEQFHNLLGRNMLRHIQKRP
jgi:hypothetical protein